MRRHKPLIINHRGSDHRVLEKLKALKTDATAMAITQAYLLRWVRAPDLDQNTSLKDMGKCFHGERLVLQTIGWYI